jgi:hypothetical protein
MSTEEKRIEEFLKTLAELSMAQKTEEHELALAKARLEKEERRAVQGVT